MDDKDLSTLEWVIAKKQAIIDNFEIYNGYPKIIWEYGIYTKEQYIKKREEENEIRKAKKY
jgi:hypothetical protein